MGVAPVVLMLRVVVVLEPVLVNGLVPNVKLAPAGNPVTLSVTVQPVLPLPLKVKVTGL